MFKDIFTAADFEEESYALYLENRKPGQSYGDFLLDYDQNSKFEQSGQDYLDGLADYYGLAQ